MSFSHGNVWIVRVVDESQAETRTWFVGPYGSTRADQVADELEKKAATEVQRSCHVEALYSNDDCLRVADYGRAEQGSLQ